MSVKLSRYVIRVLLVVLVLLTANAGAESRDASAKDLRALHEIGAEIASAMLRKDVSSLIKYDMDSLRDEHQRDLQDPKSDLYCYLFDTTCPTLHEKKDRSVYAQLKGMKSVGIAAKRLGGKASANTTYLLVFYDTTRFGEAQVKGASFLCHHAQADVPIWTFELHDGTWKAVHPLFNAETDQWCSGAY